MDTSNESLPGNATLAAALKAAAAGEGVAGFANMTWQPRWNGAEAVAAYSQSGADVLAIGFFGSLRFRLDDKASCEAIVNQARRFADMVEEAAIDYLGG